MDFSIVRGSDGTFIAQFTPTNGSQAPGTHPVWTASDASVVLTPSSDGTSCVANAPLGSTLTTFDLAISAISSDATVGTVTNTHTITVTEPTPPPPALQSIDFAQISG